MPEVQEQVVDFWATLVVKPPSAVTQTTSAVTLQLAGSGHVQRLVLELNAVGGESQYFNKHSG